MSEMVERVAKAVSDEFLEAGATPPWSSDCVKIARAALAAIREPTNAMMLAGMADYLSQERQDFKRVPWNGRRLFAVMIDEALK